MIDIGLYAVAAGVAIIMGVIAHELAHIATALVLGGRVAVDWRALHVRFQVPRDAAWRVRAVKLAPYPLGGAIVTLGLYTLAQSASPATVGVVLLGATMAFCGGADDVKSQNPQ